MGLKNGQKKKTIQTQTGIIVTINILPKRFSQISLNPPNDNTTVITKKTQLKIKGIINNGCDKATLIIWNAGLDKIVSFLSLIY